MARTQAKDKGKKSDKNVPKKVTLTNSLMKVQKKKDKAASKYKDYHELAAYELNL